MRICFVIGSMSFSGAEKVLTMITNEIKKTQDIHIILLNRQNGNESEEDGISLYGVKAEGSRFKRLSNRWSNIRKAVKKIAPDIVVSFGYVCNVNTIMSMLGLHIPLVVCERNDPVYDPRKTSEKLSRRLLYPLAKGFVFQTEKIKDYFPKRIQERACVIPNPIERPEVKWIPENVEKRFVTVARLDDFQKDQTTMIQAFVEFSHDYPEYKLEIYGDGPDREKYEKLIAALNAGDSIRLMGKTSNATGVISTAQGFLLTSIFEGMPNALMEAMAVGVPSVSTDCGGGGAKALFDKAKGVALVSIGDKAALVREMKKIVSDKTYAETLSKQAVRIIECCSKEKVSDQWKEYLQQVAKRT